MNQYRQSVTQYFNAKSKEDKVAYDTTIEKIKGAYRTFLADQSSLAKRIRKLESESYLRYEADSLFSLDDADPDLSAKEAKEYNRRKDQLTKLRTEAAALEDNTIYQQAFEWRFEFPAVLGEDGTFLGFDVVVGNPPYIRQEELAEVKPYLRDNYEVYAGTADLLVYFIELSMKNLRQNGQFSFIISNKFMRAGFGKALRRYIPQYRVHELIDFGDLPVFDEATTYPLIISLEKTAPTGEFTAANIPELHPTIFREDLAEVSFTSLQSGLTSDGWNLANAETQLLLDKLRNTGVPLGEYVKGEIYYGIKTGYNEAFVIDEETKDRLITEDPKSAEVIKPFLAGRDVKRYVPPVAKNYLLFFEKGWTKLNIGNMVEHDAFKQLRMKYPAVWQWLSTHEEKAKKRYDQGDYWWELRACDYYGKFDKVKIIFPDISLSMNAAISSNSEYGVNTLYIIPVSDIGLLGYLNSELLSFYYAGISASIRGGYFRFIRQYIETVPIATNIQSLSPLVTQILAAKAANPTADTTALEAEIDVLVYKLYGLTYAEVLVVDAEFGLGEAAYAAVEV